MTLTRRPRQDAGVSIMNKDSMALLEKLRAGFDPSPADIPESVEQGNLSNWKVVVGTRNRKLCLFGDTGLLTGSGKPWFELTEEVMFMNLNIALCADNKLWWLS